MNNVAQNYVYLLYITYYYVLCIIMFIENIIYPDSDHHLGTWK